ncbi:dihydropteroate synthase [Solemya velum gill symbiont]|uniref:Dihydropteroate synthase n=1 Tax=Solemya velum gill symbiont TaxID=2340 RepID=A0A0B0HBT4_SOVGS|nr:dihydropteroate synthase [Solemya velum gill symbiont]KHF24866.1 dihydropteroate synthase [Solemya velum gill symbiont]OOY35036.1 dihydropteroate synthase [Solemya velum gill symbiont]OOY37738.1 dihydropteroate synthase [Solemya velum gill symbiont]OOY40599.1 dihydropteroate synthase [Solemya velum gill symbiont]OOY43262.1 dihydropteroate synthase [Solemya velum gill symbiont]
MQLNCLNHVIDLSSPQVMGILNVTPDSFSDGGAFTQLDKALLQAEQMVSAGAAIIDIGGESTRPGAKAVTQQQELDRVLPVIEAVSQRLDTPVSIDTSKAVVMKEAVAAGASFVNDVNALRAEGAVETAADLGVPVCLMHMQGEPRTMQQAPHYEDVVADVSDFLLARAHACEAAGISATQIVIDPGFGFGKTLEHNLTLLQQLDQLCSLGYPLLAGISRKSMIGTLLGDRPADQRLHGSVAAAVIAAMKGARLLRVHDVAETVDAVKIVTAVLD